MDKLKKELEVLKSWGIESIPVDKVLSMIKKEEDDINTSAKEQGTEIPSAAVATSPVGGTIFYIDDTADGVYEFFDAKGNLLQNVQVGDRPHAYRVITRGTKDKYYVYHDEIYSNLRWTYCREETYVYESLNTSEDPGSGKTNTEKVMTEDGGVYITADSNWCPTIWYRLQQVRNDKVGGCDDWFVPSVNEAERLRKAIKLGNITRGIIAGSSYNESAFNSTRLWSSNGYFDLYACLWQYDDQCWDFSSKGGRSSVFFARAF